MGADAWRHQQLIDGYGCEQGTFSAGRAEPYADIPFLVEAWAATCEPPDNPESSMADAHSHLMVRLGCNPARLRKVAKREAMLGSLRDRTQAGRN